jgi:hypothetical protein
VCEERSTAEATVFCTLASAPNHKSFNAVDSTAVVIWVTKKMEDIHFEGILISVVRTAEFSE